MTHPLRVRWAEVDPQSIVFNAHYLMYFDVGVTEYWRALGFPYPDGFTGLEADPFDLFAVKATIEFHASARYDDVLDVLVRTARIGRTSMRLAVEIHRGAEHLVSGELIYVSADLKTRKPTPVGQALRDAVARYEKVMPEGLEAT